MGIYAQSWGPDPDSLRGTQCRGIVCLVHGLGEHSGRWSHVGAALAEAGYVLLAPDLRGHGQSDGPRGHAPCYEALLDDITLLLDKGRELAAAPQFLYGHSLGGNLLLVHALRRRPALAGLIATGPWLELAMRVPAWKTRLGKVMCRIAPTFAMPNGLNRPDLSRDADVVRAYETDPLVHDRISARMGMDLLDAGAWALAHAGELELPVLLMHGLADRITSAQASRRFAERVHGDCTYRGWEGLRHEIHNEPEKGEVLAAVIAWLGAHAPR